MKNNNIVENRIQEVLLEALERNLSEEEIKRLELRIAAIRRLSSRES